MRGFLIPLTVTNIHGCLSSHFAMLHEGIYYAIAGISCKGFLEAHIGFYDELTPDAAFIRSC